MTDTAVRRDRRAERRDATRAEILDHAWQVARERGPAGMSLRDVADRVGMRAPSLYGYFDSKHALYDAMFEQGYREFRDRTRQVRLSDDGRRNALRVARTFFDFAAEDPVRFQLLFQRTIPGFEPSPESYAIAEELLEDSVDVLASAGLGGGRPLDMWTAVMTGIASQHHANPRGHRWRRLLEDAVDMIVATYGQTIGSQTDDD